MARRLRNSANDEERIEEVSAEARAAIIQNACRWLADKDGERKAINAEVSEYKAKHIKGDLGMKLSDFATLYRLSQLEVEDRDHLLDTLREGFAALGLGEQASFMGALDQAAGE